MPKGPGLDMTETPWQPAGAIGYGKVNSNAAVECFNAAN